MIIGIDIRVLGNRYKSGVEEYTENLLENLLPMDKNIKFKLFFSSLHDRPLEYPWLSLPNVELFNFKIPNKLIFASSKYLNAPKLDKMMGGADAFFSPHFFLAALSGSCRRITTFHDLSYVHFPDLFSWRKNIWHNLEMQPHQQARFSHRIIAVSESTKKDLVETYQIDPAKIKVIYSGISPKIKRPEDYELAEFRSKNSLPENFLLFLGKLEPRKNIINIIRAFNNLKKQSRSDLSLVIVGSRGWLDEDIFKEAQSSIFRNSIIFKNHIADEDRRFYYSSASVFIYPSFFEGFGFPPVEAMACGTPVVTSHNSSLPEVGGSGCILVDPYNVSDLTLGIDMALKNEELKKIIIAKGLEQSAGFSWKKSAEATLECLIK